MTPVPEWRRLLRHAWSIRWMGAALIFGIGESVTAVLDPPEKPAAAHRPRGAHRHLRRRRPGLAFMVQKEFGE
jgi:hypothetical protein